MSASPDFTAGYVAAWNHVVDLMSEDGWLDRLDPETLVLVLERLNEHNPITGESTDD